MSDVWKFGGFRPIGDEEMRAANAAFETPPTFEDLSSSVERIIEAAGNNPECFKCREPITDLNEVRIITVRIDGDPVDVWAHADHAEPT